MFERLVSILNRLATIFLGSSTGKPGERTGGLFLLLSAGFFFLSFLALIVAIAMLVEGNPAAAIAFVYALVPLALAAGCFWLTFPGAWSDALYIPRAIVLVAVGLAMALFGVLVIHTGITMSRQHGFGDMLLPMIWALFNFTIAGADCLTKLWSCGEGKGDWEARKLFRVAEVEKAEALLLAFSVLGFRGHRRFRVRFTRKPQHAE